jgi:hypothetical protein
MLVNKAYSIRMRKGEELRTFYYASAVASRDDRLPYSRQVYFSEFNYYIREIGWNDSVLINSLIKLLSPKLKTSLIGVDLLGALNTCANIINKRYNNILRLILKHAP